MLEFQTKSFHFVLHLYYNNKKKKMHNIAAYRCTLKTLEIQHALIP